MSELEQSFECVSGELLWGQLHCLVEGHLAATTDLPTTIPTSVQNGTIFQRSYQHRVKAAKGQWNVGQLNSRNEYDNSTFIIGFVVYHSVLADPISIVKSCAEVGDSFSQDHDDKSIVYINKFDWGSYRDLPENVEKQLYSGVNEHVRFQISLMISQRLILVDSSFALRAIDQLRQNSLNIFDSRDVINEPVTLDNKRIGVHLHCRETEYERGWMVFNLQNKLIAFVYDGTNSELEGELYMNDACIRSADEWNQIVKEEQEEEVEDIFDNYHGKSIDRIMHELLMADTNKVDLSADRFKAYKNTVENWDEIIERFEKIRIKDF